jgi:glycosyltransferase involved in cell wall biosynthesis
MLVGRQVTSDPDVRRISTGWLFLMDRLCDRLMQMLSLEYLFYPSSYLLSRHRWFLEADVIQLYNTHGGYFSHTALVHLSQQRPVVWRLSDMWPLTGHCAYAYECERWKTGCGACPQLAGPPSRLARDTTKLLWRIKKGIYKRSSLTIVSPSAWLADLTKESPLLGHFPVHVIPNGLDTSVFRPIPRTLARQVLGLDPNMPVILFSAYAVSDQRKGGSLLIAALERLLQTELAEVTLVTMGIGAEDLNLPRGFPQKHLGLIQDDRLMAVVYSAADIFVFPTLAENLPNAVLESMACGVPTVAFRVGGIPEAVRHMETGYLTTYKDVEDLACGLRLLLTDYELRSKLGRRCREVVEQEYSLELQAQRYIHLFQSLVN